ncbi:LytTR family DNA-binding domain-containing protein [Zhouia spongiae]|uniref:LytTR family DNA-binding domain-containing protein n=1 Tax=Zhouia spongiae TaxID=2202721 RepID=A0ABY3YL30_9FLAO|nr:LytTR family DNA-binding domain-containing protein [Zhouia spongiae]UNY98527.1 LytTR family DNA-binding domain-containing protein [Zhouia spongiae]
MDVVIVEDEDLAANYLKKELFEQEVVQINSTLCISTVKEAIAYLKVHTPDLVFLDINLADGNSMEIFNSVKITAPVIFTTAYDAYAIQAFKHFTIDYLLKPFDSADLRRALQKLKQIRRISNDKLQELEQFLLTRREDYQKRFLVHKGHQLISLEVENIAFFYGSGKHLFIHSQADESYLYNDTVRDIVEKLDPDQFFKVNRNYIVNYNAVDRILRHSASKLELILKQKVPDNDQIFVSKNEVAKFKEWLDR